MPNDSKRVQALFLAAVEQSPDARAELLDRECGPDAELRQRVEALLKAHDAAGSLLERPAVQPAAALDSAAAARGEGTQDAAPAAGETAGTRVGPYKLLQKLGEGGMGAVWVAEQEHPVKRRVALKLIKPGMDSAQVLRRFEAERQALALMEHSHIARVYDAGTTESGRPYFVMELVKGEPITKYCDSIHLPIRDRLTLFTQVCGAIQHAHQKGILHRDIKPSNVLVCMQDGKPVPKVIDFGVAKALHQKLSERTMYTEVGSLVGTLEYMSPEQAELSAMDIDTRADVYALGVLLYELLTGTTPLEKKRLRAAAFDEVLRIIREEEPPRPSTRLTQSREALAGLAAQRRTEPARLAKEVRGELDWIVMRALEKDRTRRYDAPSSLARDVERYLHDEPVEAHPPRAGYRLRKFLRKHRAGVLTVAALTAVLVLGAAASTWQAVRATAAERAAQAEADRARHAELEARDSAENARAQEAKAEQKATEAQALVAFVRSLARPARERVLEGGDPSFLEAMDAAEREISARFAGSPLAEAEVRSSLGDLYLSCHDERAFAQYEQALHLRQRALGEEADLTLSGLNDLAWAYSCFDGKGEKVVPLYERILSITRGRFGPTHLQTIKSMILLAGNCFHADKAERADRLIQEAERALADRNARPGPQDLESVALQVYLGTWAEWLGKPDRGVPWLEQAEQALRPHLEKSERPDPAAVSLLNRLAAGYAWYSKLDRAFPLYERYYQALRAGVRLDGSESARFQLLYDDVAETDRFPEVYPHPSWLVEACAEPADLRRGAAVLAEHLALLRERCPGEGRRLARTLADLGELRLRLGAWGEAEAALREALSLCQKERRSGWKTFDVQSMLGAALAGQKRYAEAEPMLRKGYQELFESEDDYPGPRLTAALERLVQLYDAWGKPDEAAAWRKQLEARKSPPPGQEGGPTP